MNIPTHGFDDEILRKLVDADLVRFESDTDSRCAFVSILTSKDHVTYVVAIVQLGRTYWKSYNKGSIHFRITPALHEEITCSPFLGALEKAVLLGLVQQCEDSA